MNEDDELRDAIVRTAHLVPPDARELRLLMGPAGPRRDPTASTGEWVDLSAMVTDVRLQQRPDPFADVIADLLTRYDPGGYLLRCPLTGCGWQLLVPRMKLDPTVLEATPAGYTVMVQGVPREDVEQALGEHIDSHAMNCENDPADQVGWGR